MAVCVQVITIEGVILRCWAIMYRLMAPSYPGCPVGFDLIIVIIIIVVIIVLHCTYQRFCLLSISSKWNIVSHCWRDSGGIAFGYTKNFSIDISRAGYGKTAAPFLRTNIRNLALSLPLIHVWSWRSVSKESIRATLRWALSWTLGESVGLDFWPPRWASAGASEPPRLSETSPTFSPSGRQLRAPDRCWRLSALILMRSSQVQLSYAQNGRHSRLFSLYSLIFAWFSQVFKIISMSTIRSAKQRAPRGTRRLGFARWFADFIKAFCLKTFEMPVKKGVLVSLWSTSNFGIVSKQNAPAFAGPTKAALRGGRAFDAREKYTRKHFHLTRYCNNLWAPTA